MSIFDPADPPWPERALALARVVYAAIFVTTGTMKMFHWPPMPSHPMPPFDPMTQVGVAGILEVFGGVLILIGLFTRPVAFILSGMMAVAYFQFHAAQSFFPTVNQGVPAILYCFFFLFLVFSGAGTWSIDTMIARRRARTAS